MTGNDEAFGLLSSLLQYRIGDFPADGIEIAVSEQLWNRIADEAHYHGVVALIEPGLAKLAKKAGSPGALVARRKLAVLRARQADAVAAREKCVDDLLKAFREGDVRVVLLKGAALAHILYDRAEHRPSLDIDVLVDASNVMTAKQIAEATGFVFQQDHESKFTPSMNHLPDASRKLAGFDISLEIHVDAMSPTRLKRLTLDDLTEPLQKVPRAGSEEGLALGPYDMMRHLAHHTFEPSHKVRLVHLFDLWRYGQVAGQTRTGDDRPDLAHIQAAFAMASRVFEDSSRQSAIGGIGVGMSPLSEITRVNGPARALKMLLAPSDWWLRGFYGVAPTKSLVFTRLCRHPVTVARWIAGRYLARALRLVRPDTIRLRTGNQTARVENGRQ